MSEETKDPAIKLFGRTIPFTDTHPPPSPGASSAAEPHKAALEEVGEESEEEAAASTSVSGSDARASAVDATEGVKDASEIEAEMEVQNLNIVADSDKGKESTQFNSSSVSSANEDDHKACYEDEKATPNTKADLSKADTDGSLQEKLLKKPDKILPCPRCNSMDTKFCYYNNYNINQPRHFCKNCQRYWTAGGTMRNVPVGAGRRKSKQFSSQYHHVIMPSEGLQSPRLDNPDLAHHRTVPCGPSTSSRPLASNGTVLKFGQVPLCESMASALNIRVQKRNEDFNSVMARENKEEPSCASSITVSNGVTNAVEQIQQNGTQSYCNGVTPLPHFQCYGGTPWPYPWHPGWNNFAALTAARCPSEVVCKPENSTPNPVPWLAPPPFCHPALPFPFMPASFWGWPNGTWNIPWVGSNGGVSPTSSTSNSGCFGNSSPTLGKHSRDASLQREKIEKSLWIPKTLRIDDPDEAAKSSIWSTLGIKPDEGGIFKSFPSKDVKKAQASDAAQLLHANPAAFSRSQSFQEST